MAKKRAVKQVFKTKDEVIAELKANHAFMDKMTFVKEKFYPALCAATTSIEDATQLLSGFNTQIMQEFLGKMKKTQIKDLNLVDKLDASAEKHTEMKALLALFEDLNVFDAKDYIEGMRSEIEKFTQDELASRPLTSLKTQWLDDM